MSRDLIAGWAGVLIGIEAPSPSQPAAVARARTPGAMRIVTWSCLARWADEIDRQGRIMRPRRQLYARFDATARLLTPARIRASTDPAQVTALAQRLRDARLPGGPDLHGLNRVWSRAELGVLITEATNRARQLALGRALPRRRGPRLDPRRLPDARLEHLIQHHRDIAVVEALRAERRRREGGGPQA